MNTHHTHITITSLTHSYHGSTELRALDDVTLEVTKGEIVAIVGPSGCGKTTLLNIIAGFVRPERGSVVVNTTSSMPHVPRVGIVSQVDAVFPWLTVEQNVAYGLIAQQVPDAERHTSVKSELRRVGLSNFSRAWPRELSAGMRKRVDIARVVAARSQLLLLDEPFASLDVFTREEMQILLRDIWETNGKTLLFVTHDVEEAIFMGNRVAIMSHRPGRITKIITVPFGRKRNPSIKLDSDFIAIRREITLALRQPNHNVLYNIQH